MKLNPLTCVQVFALLLSSFLLSKAVFHYLPELFEQVACTTYANVRLLSALNLHREAFKGEMFLSW